MREKENNNYNELQENYEKLLKSNEVLEKEMKELKTLMKNNVEPDTDFSVVANIDSFYTGAWEKLTTFLGWTGSIFVLILGALFGYLEFKALADFEDEIQENKIELEQYVEKRIETYERVLNMYKNDTIEKAKEEAAAKVIEEVDESIEEINENTLATTKELKIELEKIVDEKMLQLEELVYISEINARIGAILDKTDFDDSIIAFNNLLEKIEESDSKLSLFNKNKLKSEVYYHKGVASFHTFDYDESINFYKEALEFNSKNDAFYIGLGDNYLKLSDEKRALEVFEQALSLNPKNAEIYNKLGISYEKLGNYEKAVEFHKKAVDLAPNQENYYCDFGTTYFEAEEYKSALNEFVRAIKLNPNHHESYQKLGYTYMKLRNYKKAIKNFKSALKLNPENEFIESNLKESLILTADYGDALEIETESSQYRVINALLDFTAKTALDMDTSDEISTIELSLDDEPVEWAWAEFEDWLEHSENTAKINKIRDVLKLVKR